MYENRIIKIYNWFSIIKCITSGGREILGGLISSQVKPADFHEKLKGYLRYKTITSKNESSEAQVKDFFVL